MAKIAVSLFIVLFLFPTLAPAADIVGKILEGIGGGLRSGIQAQERRTNKLYPPAGRQQKEIELGIRLYNEGSELDKRGQHKEAIVKLEKALDIAVRNNISFGAMNCLLLLGFSHRELKETEVAISYFKEALRIAKAVNDAERERSSLSMLAICYEELGDLSTSIRYQEERLSLAKRIGDIKEQIETLSSLSGYYGTRDKIKSLSYKEQALQLSRKIGDKQLEAQLLHNFGLQLLGMGNAQKAIDCIKQALALGKETKNKAMVADCTAAIGEVHSYLGDYAKAIQWIENASKLYGEERKGPGQLLCLSGLGHIYMTMENYNKAIDYFKQSKIVASRFDYLTGTVTAYLDTCLAICHLLVGEKVIAHQLIKSADSSSPLLISLFYLLDGNPNKAVSGIPKQEILGYPKELFVGQSKEDIIGLYTIFGLGYERLGDFKTAEHCFKMAIEVTENQRADLYTGSKKQFFGGKTFPPYDRLTAYEGLARISNQEMALACSEAMKARTFLEIVARKHDTHILGIPDDLKSQEEKLEGQFSELQRKQESALRGNDKSRITAYERELNQLKQDKEHFINKIYNECPQYATIRYPRPLNLSGFKMNKDEALLEYLITETKTLGWLIRDNKIVKSTSINISRKEIEGLIDLYLSQIECQDQDAEKNKQFDPKLGYNLYKLLVKNFVSSITPSDKIIIIPDKKLGLLPFEALVAKLTENNIQPRDNASSLGVKFLGDEYNISYYQSLSAMSLIRNIKKGASRCEKNIFILADPVFSPTDERLKNGTQVSVNKTTPTQMKELQDLSGIRFDRLQKTEFLITSLTKLFEGKGVDHLSNIEATETNMKAKDLSRYKYVVFATHGVLDTSVSRIMEPALVLGQFGNKKGDDGFLTMTEVLGLNLNCDIAALTACQTGKGRLVSGEGVMGLARAFQCAGSKAVLATLWSVSEESSMILVDKFFQHIKEGSDRMTSLRYAKMEVRKLGYDHPYFWAPFILIGESQN